MTGLSAVRCAHELPLWPQLFYQDHLGIGGGITWGHVVSRDLTHFARVGVGLWNDERKYTSNRLSRVRAAGLYM